MFNGGGIQSIQFKNNYVRGSCWYSEQRGVSAEATTFTELE